MMQFNWLWGYFIPLGILLLAWGGLPPRRARRVTPLVGLALALAVVAYWAVGYAFHLGGAGVVNPEDPALAGLDRIFGRDVGWGLFGLAGFGLAGDEITPAALALFLAYLPVVATAVLLVVLALAEARRWLVVLAGGLAGGLVVPVAANWAWGGGWLSHLGETLDLGHGFVDFGGAGLMAWLPAAMVTGLLLLLPRRVVEEPPAPPPAYFPLLANAGALLLGLGWMGWALSLPLHTFGANLDLYRAAINVFLGMAGAVLTSQLYAWLVTGEIEPLMAARGLAAGWVAVLAGAPFLPPWAALVVGLVAGIAFPLLLYAVEVGLRLRDAAASVALGLTGGLWGLLAVALFADGRWGQGWNGVGVAAIAGVAGIVAGGGMGQLLAQLAGLLALGLWGLLWGALLGGLWRLTLWRPSPRRAEEPAVVEATEEIDDEGEVEELEGEESELVPVSEAGAPPLPLSVNENGE